MKSSESKKFAIISVSDKSNIDVIAKKLVKNNYQILSTGGTAKHLTKKIYLIFQSLNSQNLMKSLMEG